MGKMKKKKKAGVFDRIKLLNPRNLEHEVHVYGYSFSWKKHVLIIICSLLGISAIGILFRLGAVYFTAVILATAAVLPVFVLNMYKGMYEQKRFADAVTYCEQMLYAFQKSGKIASALQETREVFEGGRMREIIDGAIAYLEAGQQQSDNIFREALQLIEEQYACVKIHMVHELLISSEEYGGKTENSIYLMLNDIEFWKRRGYQLQADKKTSHTDNMISIVVATVLCAVALYVLNAMGNLYPGAESVDIFTVGVIQISSFVFILFQLYVLAKSFRSLAVNWLQSEMLHDTEYVLSSYDTVMSYDDGKEKKRSIILSALFFAACVPAFLFHVNWLGILCILIAAFMLMQHKIGYSLAKKDVNSELYLALPQWLMEIALLLQTNNVQVSIVKSMEQAPVVLRYELEQLVQRLQEQPDKLSSYTDFCKNFDVPEVQSCMKMLHAISESGTGNAQVQINNLIQRVNEMQNMADNIRNESIAFKAKMIFSYPVLAATVKLLIDLTVGMVYMMSMLGSMGGV